MKIYFAKREQVVFSVTHVQLAVYIPVKYGLILYSILLATLSMIEKTDAE